MSNNQTTLIGWFNQPHWSIDVSLGLKDERYVFRADWNNRNKRWGIIILLDNEVIIQGVNLTLDVDVLELCNHAKRPECLLIPMTSNQRIERITYENMCNGEVKLFHLTN